MTYETRNRARLLTTAMTFAIAAPGLAQAQSEALMNEQQLAGLTEECRLVAEEYVALDVGSDIIDRDGVLRILTLNETARCAELRAQFEESEVATEAVRLEEQAVIEGAAKVRVPTPQVDVQQQPAEVTVQGGQPRVQVTEQASNIQVEQAQPRVTIDVPEIAVRVEIPAPSIYIQSAEPDVQVAMQDPQVEVVQPEPQVSVRQGEPQLAVDLDVDQGAEGADTTEMQVAEGEGGGANVTSATDANVQIARAEPQVQIVQPEGNAQHAFQQAEPQVSYTPAEPVVTFNMPEQPAVEFANVGEPNVVYETQAEREERRMRQEQAAAAPAEAPAAAPEAAAPAMTVAEMMEMDVIGANGEDLGTPQAIVREGQQVLLVMRDGGFLGLGGNEVGVPMGRVSVEGDALQLRNMSAEEIENAGGFEYDAANRLSDDRQIRLNAG